MKLFVEVFYNKFWLRCWSILVIDVLIVVLNKEYEYKFEGRKFFLVFDVIKFDLCIVGGYGFLRGNFFIVGN